jgi:hypothetical protein
MNFLSALLLSLPKVKLHIVKYSFTMLFIIVFYIFYSYVPLLTLELKE